MLNKAFYFSSTEDAAAEIKYSTVKPFLHNAATVVLTFLFQ